MTENDVIILYADAFYMNHCKFYVTLEVLLILCETYFDPLQQYDVSIQITYLNVLFQ